MSLRRVFLALLSFGFSIGLVVLLVKIGHIDLYGTLRLVRRASAIAFLKLLFLNFLLVLISTVKWRSIDTYLRSPADSVPSRMVSFALTSAGMTLGLALPVQLGMTAARSTGTYLHGRALKRGMVGTILDQGFDALIVGLLAIASAFTRIVRGGSLLWTLLAAAIVSLALLLARPSVQLTRRIATWVSIKSSRKGRIGAVLQSLGEIQHSPVVKTSLARQLVLLSAVRFVIVVLMAAQTAAAIGAAIPLWHFAAAVPFVFIASFVAITPGALGVNELTFTSALSLFGTSLPVAAQWSLANRILGTAACILVTGCAAIAFGVQRVMVDGRGTPAELTTKS